MPARRNSRAPLRAAVDTGGTFTDCVWLEAGRVRMRKVFSTPADPSQAIVDALEFISPGGGLLLLHGTTVGTNTLLQRQGARVALITTAGFEDAIEIGRQARPRLYDFFFDRPKPLVPSELRFGVVERTAPGGEILEKPSRAQLTKLARAVARAQPEAIAVCFLFSFANPSNEQAVAGALAALRIPFSLAHLVLPEFREYERASTVTINAYLQPIMQRYLERLDRRASAWTRRAGRVGVRIFVMQSSGGITSLAAAASEPVRTVLSGPAGGVVGASAMARRSGFERIISFDMGGTSTDVCLVEGRPVTTNEAEIAGLPVRVPMLNIHTVGAGGGSLARFDAAGALRVGPQSAGADPGPICYGRGEQPTVTDANLLLGRIPPDRFLGGEFRLDLERTRRLVQAWIRGQHSNLALESFAAGVVRVVNANMEKAIRVVSIERGYDPRDFTLIAFGGAGGLHACDLASALGIQRVIVPVLPGALSAYGILVSDVVKDYSRTVVWRVSGQLPLERLNTEFSALERRARRELRAEQWAGRPCLERRIDVRYHGQGYELNLPFSRELLAAFHEEHHRRYGYSHPGREVELVTLRLRAAIAGHPPATAASIRSGEVKPVEAKVFFDGRWLSTPVYDRDSLPAGRRQRGPAVIAEYSATTVVPPGMRFHVDRAGNLVVEV